MQFSFKVAMKLTACCCDNRSDV